MTFLHSLLSLPREGLVITVAVIVALLALVWLWTRLSSRQRFVTIKRSEETELLAFHLRRIADAVEKLAAARERENQSPVDAGASGHVTMSTFGR